MVADIRFKILSTAHNYHAVNQSLNQLMYAIITLLACYAVMQGQLTLGAFLAVQYILGQAVKPTSDITSFIQDYQDAKLSLERMRDVFENQLDFTVLQEPASNKNSQMSLKHDITFKSVAFSYHSGVPFIEDLNLFIPYGSKIAIVGKSGSGKSTLLKLLLKLLTPTRGSVQVGYQDLKNIPDEGWMQQFGVLLQESIVFNGNIEYNITFQTSQEVDTTRLSDSIESSQFSQVLNGLADGIYTPLSKSGQNLSKGQVQRLLIARALYQNTNYLMLDEPTSALDNETSAEVMRNLIRFSQDKTLIVTTHNLNLTKDFDWVIFMDKGSIIEQGKPVELLKNKSNYFELLYSN
jgi:ATP-binding cassette subfamily B protein